MCLAIPGRVVALVDPEAGLPFATVRFGAMTRRVCLAYTPHAEIGDYVIVHVGFALQVLDEEAAHATLRLLGEVSS